MSVLDGPSEATGSLADLWEHGDYDVAWVRLHEQAAEVDPADSTAQLNMMLWRARLLLVRGAALEAQQLTEQALSGTAVQLPIVVLHAQALSVQGKVQAAEEVLTDALHSRSAMAQVAGLQAQLLLGELRQERGALKAARTAFQAVVRAQERLLPLQACGDLGEAKRHSCFAVALRKAPATGRAELLRYSAIARSALGQVESANRFFALSMAFGPAVETLVAWAQSYAARGEAPLASRLLDLALSRNPHYPDALALRARLHARLSSSKEAAQRDIERSLLTNPRHVPTLAALATLQLHGLSLEQAEATLDRAQLVRPNDLGILSLRAVARYLADDHEGQARATKEVLLRHGQYAEVFLTLAQFADGLHRYQDQLDFSQQALALAPSNVLAQTMVGMDLLRMGYERKGRVALKKALELRTRNPQVRETLKLYQTVIDRRYVTLREGPFRVRVSRAQRPVLEPYVGPFLRLAYSEMTQRYGIVPQGPLRVELYDSEEHFAVRATGKSHAGVQGVCFGQVIAAVSPAAAEFNWGQILWHELSHVFHLQLSDYRVPRWFTEGLAEYETEQARPEWRREEARALWKAQRQGALPVLTQLEEAFSQASTADELMTAYYTATVAVRHLVERFGFPAMVEVLRGYAQGKSLSESLNVSLANLQMSFAAYLERLFEPFHREFAVADRPLQPVTELVALHNAQPHNAQVAANLALGLLGEGEFELAEQPAREALRLENSQPAAHFALSRIAMERGDTAAAREHIAAIVRGGHDSPLLRRLLALAARAAGDLDDALQQVQAALAQDMDDLDAYRLWLELAVERTDRVQVLAALRGIARLDQHDRTAYRLLLRALYTEGDVSSLVQVGEAALFVDPGSASVHELLAAGYLATGQYAAALLEYEQALKLADEPTAPIHFGRARALLHLRREQEARQALQTAVELQPDLLPAEALQPRGVLEQLLEAPASP